MDADELLTTREAAELARCSPESVIRWILHDGLPALRRRAGRGWRYLVPRRALLARLEHVGPAPLPPQAPARLPLSRRTREVLQRFGLLECVEDS